MGELDWIIMVIGGGLVLLSLIDAFLTILHNDTDGPIIRFSFYSLWSLLIGITRIVPSSRRTLLPLAGPLMIVLAVAIWVGLFILGFALIYWPTLEQFNLQGSLQPVFMTALYFSGTTATVLGYGDVSPESGVMQLISFLQAGLGFALMTGIITYLISVVSGVSDRNALSLRLWIATGRTGDGTEAFIRILPFEAPGDIRHRLQSIHDQMYRVHQKMYQFPILDLYYRSRNPVYAPELMLRYAMDLAITALIVSEDRSYRALRVVAGELAEVTHDMMQQILDEHLGEGISRELNLVEPKEADRNRLNQMVLRLREELPDLDIAIGTLQDTESVLRLIARLRYFLEVMEGFTRWQMDDVLE